MLGQKEYLKRKPTQVCNPILKSARLAAKLVLISLNSGLGATTGPSYYSLKDMLTVSIANRKPNIFLRRMTAIHVYIA